MKSGWIKIDDTVVNTLYISSFRHQGDMTCYAMLGEPKERSVYDPNEVEYRKIIHALGMLTDEEYNDFRERVRKGLPIRRVKI